MNKEFVDDMRGGAKSVLWFFDNGFKDASKNFTVDSKILKEFKNFTNKYQERSALFDG